VSATGTTYDNFQHLSVTLTQCSYVYQLFATTNSNYLRRTSNGFLFYRFEFLLSSRNSNFKLYWSEPVSSWCETVHCVPVTDL